MKFLKALMFTMMAGFASASDKTTDIQSGNDAGVETQVAKDARIQWTGAKITGEHTGGVSLKDGWLKNRGGKVAEIYLEADMNSMTNDDVKSPEWNQKLVDHLKSDDFFGVSAHPVAKLHVHEITPVEGTEYVFVSDLTIKGTTKRVIFKGRMMTMDHGMHLKAELDVDRTDYNVRYNSGSFFENLGDKLIYDEFELDFNVPFFKSDKK